MLKIQISGSFLSRVRRSGGPGLVCLVVTVPSDQVQVLQPQGVPWSLRPTPGPRDSRWHTGREGLTAIFKSLFSQTRNAFHKPQKMKSHVRTLSPDRGIRVKADAGARLPFILPALPCISCVTLCKLLNLSVPRFPYPYDDDNTTTSLPGLS